MSLAGKFYSPRDLKFVDSINSELYGDVVQCDILLYKVSVIDTKVNMYGEVDQSNSVQYFPGVEITTLIENPGIDSEYTDFGPDRKQTLVFRFREKMLKLINIFPENGDLIKYNERFYAIDNVVQEQFLGSIPDKSLSIICNANYTRLSKISIVNRQY